MMYTSNQNADPGFYAIQERFLKTDIAPHQLHSDKTRWLITLACFTALQASASISAVAEKALEAGVTAAEIKETIYHTTPYVGIPRVEAILQPVNTVLHKCGCSGIVEDHSTVTAETRFSRGLAVQKTIFGEVLIEDGFRTTPADTLHIRHCLASNCFGDYYTRSLLDLQTRELITFTVVFTLGGCEEQVRAHIQGNLNVGNTRKTLIDAVTTCLPYIGYPRTLNALTCIDRVCTTLSDI